jgi:phosphoenolpyruvate carboxylase
MIIDLVLTSHPTMIFNIDGSLRSEKPTIYDEFNFISYYLNFVQNILNKNFKSDKLKIKLSTWCGGDRDGHPGVTSDVTNIIMNKLNSFEKKFNLDIREDSNKIINLIIEKIDSDWLLKNNLEKEKILNNFDYNKLIDNEILKTIKVMEKNQNYIISNCESYFEIFFINTISKFFGKSINIVPLFESFESLNKSSNILENAIIKNIYLNNTIQVMLAYSDTSKKCGVISSTYLLYQTQIEIYNLFLKYNKVPIFFHGRGGSFPRGGGCYENFFKRLPNESINEIIRITVQGERIFREFKDEKTTLATIKSIYEGMDERIKLNDKYLNYKNLNINNISELSRKLYVKNITSDVIDYFVNFTHHKKLSELNSGSRPGSRKENIKSLEEIRAITWVFGWSTSEFYLPWWLGFNNSFNKFIEDNDFLPWKVLLDEIKIHINKTKYTDNIPINLLLEHIRCKLILENNDKLDIPTIVVKRGYVG